MLLSLFVASAQLFNCLTPDAGILRLVFNLFFLFLLWNTLAAQPDRIRLLRSLLVVFGWAYVMRYVALAALADPAGGVDTPPAHGAARGGGGPSGEPTAPLAGYIAFATVALYMIGLVLLPRPVPSTAVAVVATRAEEVLE